MNPILPLLAILTIAPLLPAQEEAPQAGFLNVLNLVSLRGPTRIELGGFLFNGGDPVPAGEGSGIIAITPGQHSFAIENAEARPRKVSGYLIIKDGATVAVICYDEIAETRDGRQEAKLRYTVLVEGEAGGPRLSLVSLLKAPFAGVAVSGTRVTLAPRKAHRIPLAVGDPVKIEYQGQSLAEFEVLTPAHHLGFLFENPATGEVGLSLIVNEKLEYQPPLDSDEDEE